MLESTVVPLEIAHEHRNYLPSLGLLLAGAGVLLPLVEHWRRRAAVALLATLGAVLAGTTALRADQWGDELGMSRYEVRHHPRSAQARNNLAADLVWRGDYAEAREQLDAAIELAPWEVGYPMNLVGAYRVEKLEPPATLDSRDPAPHPRGAAERVRQHTLQRYSECLGKGCRYLLADVVGWLEAYRDSGQPTFDRSYIEYLLGVGYREQGRIQDALNAFQRAHDSGPASTCTRCSSRPTSCMACGQWDSAALVLERHPRRQRTRRISAWTRQIGELEAAIAKGRRRQGGRAYTRRHRRPEAGNAMNYHDFITIEPGKRGGKPCVRGLRITVYDVLDYLAAGMTPEQIVADFDYLTLDDIRACLAYAADRERHQLVQGA